MREKGRTKFHVLGRAESIPVGSSVDTTKGKVRLASAKKGGGTQTMVFFDGRFKVHQNRRSGAHRPEARGRQLPLLPRRRARRKARARGPCGGSGATARGGRRTSGHNGSGTVRGTFWLTEDRCDGTFFKVRQGVVAVRDFTRHRTVVLHAGEHYLAPAR